MANIASLIWTVVLVVIVITTTTSKAGGDGDEEYIISSRGKVTHLRLYLQNDATLTRNATDVNIIPPRASNSAASAGSAFLFGTVDAIDDPLTVGPSLNSTTVARAEGIYAYNSQHEYAMWTVINLAFLRGRYNGSTLTVVGRNQVTSLKPRELPIVGGTGVFRMARGYVIMTTYFFDLAAGIAVVEYNIYVEHY